LIYIKGGIIIDANGVRNDPAIIIKDDRITEVGSSKTLVAPQNAEVVNASSLVLMPGLIDSHVHLWGSAKGDQRTFGERFEVRLIRSAVKECRARQRVAKLHL
jgi:imidazolonepropionase-like amidohydrolase